MRILLRNFLVFLGCLHMLGGSHSIIQIYAWSKMLASYSQETNFSQALVDTFSGEKPCDLCEKISASKSTNHDDGKENLPWSPKSSIFFPDLIAPTYGNLDELSFELLSQVSFFSYDFFKNSLSYEPLIPPPRC